MTTIIGQIISAARVQRAIREHLQTWLPTYLCEIDEQEGLERGLTAWPRSWQKVPRFDDTLSGQVPALLIICPGTAGKPIKEGDGTYRVTWTVGVAALVKGKDQESASDTAKRYAAAISACVLQERGRIVPVIHAATWVGDTYDDNPITQDRTMSAATVHFDIEFSKVVSDRDGPANPIETVEGKDPYEEPLPEPKTEQYPPWGVIPDSDHISVTVEPKETP